LIGAIILAGRSDDPTPRRSALKRGILISALLGQALAAAAASQDTREARFVELGGIEQWVTIRGVDANKPVLLVAHGGPGDVLSPHVEEFAPYEKEFIVVQWDQRGSGRTYGLYGDETPDLTLERVATDGIELATYLTKHLKKANVIVLGHSWGSVIAIEMATRRPDLFSAYVGTGQVASWERSVQAQFDFLVGQARRTGDQELSAELATIQPLDPRNLDHFRQLNAPLRRQLNDADATWLRELREWATRSLTEQELADLSGGMSFSGRSLISTQIDVDLFETAPRLEIPMFVIQGRDDLFTPTGPAIAYFEYVEAPLKKLVVIEDAGHFALVTHQAAFLNALLDTTRNVTDIDDQ
jgi:pimeloyl-ACP methyl ester carboxylesterase